MNADYLAFVVPIGIRLHASTNVENVLDKDIGLMRFFLQM